MSAVRTAHRDDDDALYASLVVEPTSSIHPLQFTALPGENAVEVIHGRASVERALLRAVASCQTELTSLSAGRGKGRLARPLRRAGETARHNGAVNRAIFHYAELRDEATSEYLREMTQDGAQVRLTRVVPGQGLVVDRRTALIPFSSDETPEEVSLAIVRETATVGWALACFEQFWMTATPIEEVPGWAECSSPAGRVRLDPTRVKILRLMAEGEKDEVIARRLSISVRTCRRHIADYLEQVGAASRFQAGVIAAQSGHLRPRR
ncbi:regulatory protein, luxR family [Frankineae bacterium MT45]|nr:regulatory protein, luxR family [Frankineae bacterium MT45]